MIGSTAVPCRACGGRLSMSPALVAPDRITLDKVLRAVGGQKNGNDSDRLLALKSGNFGGPEFFSDALQLMR